MIRYRSPPQSMFPRCVASTSMARLPAVPRTGRSHYPRRAADPAGITRPPADQDRPRRADIRTDGEDLIMQAAHGSSPLLIDNGPEGRTMRRKPAPPGACPAGCTRGAGRPRPHPAGPGRTGFEPVTSCVSPKSRDGPWRLSPRPESDGEPFTCMNIPGGSSRVRGGLLRRLTLSGCMPDSVMMPQADHPLRMRRRGKRTCSLPDYEATGSPGV